jgi:hypothetical protein
MKTELKMVAMFLMMFSSALGQTVSGTVAGLPPELRDAVLQDAACSQSSETASGENTRTNWLETAVATRDIRSAGGANVGTIVAFSDACRCRDANCGTYVYLKNGPGYKLAFSGTFSSLHPVRVFKHGYPSLSGKVQLNKAQAESTVYDWNGKTYAPSLCATITQGTGRKVPSIMHHECAKTQ